MNNFKRTMLSGTDFGRVVRRLWPLMLLLPVLLLPSCSGPPIGARKTSPSVVYHQTHNNPVGEDRISPATLFALRRFELEKEFDDDPDAALAVMRQKAGESRERGMLFALSELNYFAGERLRHSVKPWEPRDSRDYYLASAVYAWLFLLGDAADPPPGSFDERFSSACDLYNYSLGWALTQKHRSTNALAVIAGGTRRVPGGEMEIDLKTNRFPYALSDFDRFVIADQYLVRGLSVRNRQRGLGAPLIAMTRVTNEENKLARAVPVSVLLRLEGGLTNLAKGQMHATLEVYSPFDDTTVQVGGASVPLETDTTVGMAYALNQAFLWNLGMMQFFSSHEQVPSGIYLAQPYQRGKVPVVFVHGTFSSPVWWAEMGNTLAGDPVLSQRCQFWYFIYNSGNPMVYSALRLREALTEKIKELDPEGRDPALQQMVVIGHSQGGLLTKLTATDTGDKMLDAVLKTNSLASLGLSSNEVALVREYTCFEALPFVKRVVFICTPHRGSYMANNLLRNLARKLVVLPAKLVRRTSELAGLQEKLNLPRELRGTPTSLDSMSTNNPFLLALAEIPVAPGIKVNSIIAMQGEGDYHHAMDGLVSYQSAHVDYSESEFIVHSFHSCLSQPATIEEVRRILREHIADLPEETAVTPGSQ
jgi:pimeloyl-ACP methyl ester carboxylesterase